MGDLTLEHLSRLHPKDPKETKTRLAASCSSTTLTRHAVARVSRPSSHKPPAHRTRIQGRRDKPSQLAKGHHTGLSQQAFPLPADQPGRVRFCAGTSDCRLQEADSFQ